jgi:hypothetical protein
VKLKRPKTVAREDGREQTGFQYTHQMVTLGFCPNIEKNEVRSISTRKAVRLTKAYIMMDV